MNRKKVTLFIVTNREGQTRKITLPVGWLQAGGFLAVILATVLVAGVVDYFGLLVQTLENKRLVAENAQLRKQFSVVEGKVESLEHSLERVKSFYTKLKLITDVEDSDRDLKLAVGPLPKPGQAIDEVGMRAPSAMDGGHHGHHGHAPRMHPGEEPIKDAAMAQPLDLVRGELAVENKGDYLALAVRIDRAVEESQLKEQSILDLWESLSERQSLLNSTPSVKPVKGWYTSRFGYRISPWTQRPVMHNGLDIAAAPGTPVRAPADGVVSFAGFDEGYGKLVSIDHGYGLVTRYAHNSQLFVTVGQRVSRWDVIAAVGNTGRSTGPHLHYEVRYNGVPVDPANYILE